MRTSRELTACFLSDLKKYNSPNFKSIAKADLSKQDAIVHKAFSSVITRYFIFKEKHPEITDEEFKLLYFVLSLDLVAQYFANYPDTTTENLVAFQLHLKNYVKEQRHLINKEGDVDVKDTSISNIELEPDNELPIQQQSEPVSVTN